MGAGNTYQGESWWNNSGGAGGFGVSAYFALPAYQAPYTSSINRSVPDVSAFADSTQGILVCQGVANNTPICGTVGGTSLSTPLWAGAWALAAQVKQQVGGGSSANGGFVYDLPTYPNNFTNAFHPASSMTGPGNDFAHVGLGSPIIANIAAKLALPPSISAISANGGPMGGGTSVTITGTGFVSVLNVTFGNVPAASVTVISTTELSVVSPLQTTPSIVDITVATPAGVSKYSSADKFRYWASVTSVVPDAGPMQGQQAVDVYGAGFNFQNWPNTTDFLFGGVPATGVYCYSSTHCSMAIPAHAPGIVTVQVGQGSGVAFTYQSPSITSISPSTGGEVENTPLTLYGVSLASMTVTFEKLDANGNVTWSTSKVAGCQDSIECSLWTPPGTGSVHIVVTVNNLTSPPTAAAVFTYLPYPEVTSVSPAGGPAAGGTTVTITGINFLTGPGQTTFMFGHSQATTVSCATTTSCTAITPAWNSVAEWGVNDVPIFPTVSFNFGKGSTVLHESWTGNYGPAYPVQYFAYPGPCTVAPGGVTCPTLPPPPPKPCKGTTCQ